MGVCRKRVGWAEPAFAQTISGGRSWFQVVTSEMMRTLSSGLVRSAERKWKR